MVKKLHITSPKEPRKFVKEADELVVDYNNMDYEVERSHDWALKNKDIAFDKVANILAKSIFTVNDEDDIVIFIDNVVDKLPVTMSIYSDISPANWTIVYTNDGRFIAEPSNLDDCVITAADNHLVKEAESLGKMLKELTFWYNKEFK